MSWFRPLYLHEVYFFINTGCWECCSACVKHTHLTILNISNYFYVKTAQDYFLTLVKVKIIIKKIIVEFAGRRAICESTSGSTPPPVPLHPPASCATRPSPAPHTSTATCAESTQRRLEQIYMKSCSLSFSPYISYALYEVWTCGHTYQSYVKKLLSSVAGAS